jgi:hypothetical protein
MTMNFPATWALMTLPTRIRFATTRGGVLLRTEDEEPPLEDGVTAGDRPPAHPQAARAKDSRHQDQKRMRK